MSHADLATFTPPIVIDTTIWLPAHSHTVHCDSCTLRNFKGPADPFDGKVQACEIFCWKI